MHPDQAQNTSSGIQGQEATAVAVIYVTAPTVSSVGSPVPLATTNMSSKPLHFSLAFMLFYFFLLFAAPLE